jgi:hypothetical protein
MNHCGMTHYNFATQFRTIYDQAVHRFASGIRGANSVVTPEERTFLAANGITAQHIYDYAEDHNVDDGEPGFERALAIEIVRRDYFLNVQGAVTSTKVLDESTLPGKTTTLRGIEWLPRIIPKARAKLRGELPSSLMYCCGGDRKFLKEHDIFPAEFLSLVWRHDNDEGAIADWVVRRSKAVATA